ncbi:MAG: ATP-binding protein [Gammaproteobacteria bacterium]|nr:ATP-binding protein [Gammaproteobacteria bacterium]
MIRDAAEEAYFRSNPIERVLALRLDEAFDISFGSAHGELSMWLADPKTHIRERFGFAKELLVIFSKHRRTDARVLTAIESISRSPEFKHRVERAVVLLVHSGDPDRTEMLLQEHPDWIIVPFATSELTDVNRGDLFVRARIAQYIGALDLFGMASPITSDRYFFGRNDLVQQLIVRLVERGENCGLFGLRKTGKTSVLFAIDRRTEGQPNLIEYVDCQNPGIHSARWWQVLETIVERVVDSLRRKHKRTIEQSRYTRETAGNAFLKDVRALLSDGCLEHVTLLFDEVEYITPKVSGALGKHWDEDFEPFWQTIRAVHHEVQRKLTFVVAGVNPSAVTTSHFEKRPNPIFQLATPLYVNALDEHQVRDMVRTIGRYSGLSIDEATYPFLTATYGGHPFLTRIACSEVARSADTSDALKRAAVGPQDFATSSTAIRARLERPIRDILLSLVWWYPEEYDVLTILADGDEDFVQEYLANDAESVLRFTHYGLLTADGRRFSIADLKTYLQTNGDSYRKELSPFRRGDMPPELLPEIPDLKLLGELFEKRSEIEIKLRRAIMLYLGVKNNWDDGKIASAVSASLKKRGERRDPEKLFVGRRPKDVMNELFTLDLKDVMLNNWDVFGPLFERNKARFEMNMDTLNKARRVDAHTKPANQGEVSEIQNSYSWLEARLSAIQLPLG